MQPPQSSSLRRALAQAEIQQLWPMALARARQQQQPQLCELLSQMSSHLRSLTIGEFQQLIGQLDPARDPCMAELVVRIAGDRLQHQINLQKRLIAETAQARLQAHFTSVHLEGAPADTVSPVPLPMAQPLPLTVRITNISEVATNQQVRLAFEVWGPLVCVHGPFPGLERLPIQRKAFHQSMWAFVTFADPDKFRAVCRIFTTNTYMAAPPMLPLIDRVHWKPLILARLPLRGKAHMPVCTAEAYCSSAG